MAIACSVLRICVFMFSVMIFTSVFCTISARAEEDYEPEIGIGSGTGTTEPEIGTGSGTGTTEPELGTGSGTGIAGPAIGAGSGTGTAGPGIGTGTTGHDPAQIVPKALLCFNDKYIYSSCEESYRLTASGNLDVPQDMTETYCGGPCLTETHLVLDCIDNILTTFMFYNKATIQDVRDTIHAGCGYGPERGNFNVAEHIQAEESNAQKVAIQIVVVLGLMIIGHGLLY